MIQTKDSVRALEEYYVLQDHSVIKLNQNESPLDVPKHLKEKILNRLNEWHFNRYAANRPEALHEAIAAYTGHPAEGIIAGNGSNELIQAVLAAFCDAGDKILVVSPGFSVYTRVAKITGLGVVDIPLREDLAFNVPAIVKHAGDVDMLIFANPNAPTGTVMTMNDIREIAENFNGPIVIDEAYFEFHRDSALPLMQSHENIIILRTFSKAFSLAGLRLGYLMAVPRLATDIEKAKLPFSVGILGQIAGEVLMRNHHVVDQLADEIIDERDRLIKTMQAMDGIHVVESHTNFILFSVAGKQATDVHESIYKRGVLLRYLGGERLRDYIRVSVGTREENDTFLNILSDVASS